MAMIMVIEYKHTFLSLDQHTSEAPDEPAQAVRKPIVNCLLVLPMIQEDILMIYYITIRSVSGSLNW